MTSRKRVFTALVLQELDRVPFLDACIDPTIQKVLLQREILSVPVTSEITPGWESWGSFERQDNKFSLRPTYSIIKYAEDHRREPVGIYFMTKGHFHLRETAEIYFCLRGQGYLLTQNNRGEVHTIQMSPGVLGYIPPGQGHRTLNTGPEEFVFLAVYPADAGHNYRVIEEKGFARIMVEEKGHPQLKDNPGYWKS